MCSSDKDIYKILYIINAAGLITSICGPAYGIPCSDTPRRHYDSSQAGQWSVRIVRSPQQRLKARSRSETFSIVHPGFMKINIDASTKRTLARWIMLVDRGSAHLVSLKLFYGPGKINRNVSAAFSSKLF